MEQKFGVCKKCGGKMTKIFLWVEDVYYCEECGWDKIGDDVDEN